MKKIIILIVALILQGCASTEAEPTAESIEISGQSENADIEENFFFNVLTQYSDVHDIGIPIKTGQSAIVRFSQEEFSALTEKELWGFLIESRECEHHDWHAIVIEEDSAILCSYNQEKIVYGIWDEKLGVTEILGYYEIQQEGGFRYLNSKGEQVYEYQC